DSAKDVQEGTAKLGELGDHRSGGRVVRGRRDGDQPSTPHSSFLSEATVLENGGMTLCERFFDGRPFLKPVARKHRRSRHLLKTGPTAFSCRGDSKHL